MARTSTKNKSGNRGAGPEDVENRFCGVVRPISPVGNYSAVHWEEVGSIIDDAIREAGFEARLVSDGNSTGIIHARIVANLYRDDIIVCDISGKNPNVMLELGMRLAFDKPVVVIKDDLTDYSFDTSPIEHLTYPASLHFPSIVDFKERLSEKVAATCDNFDASKSFLQQFGPIKVAEIEEVRVPGYEIVREELRELRSLIQATQTSSNVSHLSRAENTKRNAGSFLIYKKRLPEELVDEVSDKASRLSPVKRISISFTETHMMVRVTPERLGGWDQHEANEAVRSLLREYLKDIPLPKG